MIAKLSSQRNTYQLLVRTHKIHEKVGLNFKCITITFTLDVRRGNEINNRLKIKSNIYE